MENLKCHVVPLAKLFDTADEFTSERVEFAYHAGRDCYEPLVVEHKSDNVALSEVAVFLECREV